MQHNSQGAARGGPVALRPVRPTPCLRSSKALLGVASPNFSSILADHGKFSADCYLFTFLNSGLVFGHGRPS